MQVLERQTMFTKIHPQKKVTSPKTTRANILFVDNRSEYRAMIHNILGHDYTTRVAGSGRGALEAIQMQLPDILLMDWQLPDMDGQELLVRVRQFYGGDKIPIIICGTYNYAVVKGECENWNIAGYLRKPFTTAHLKSVVNVALNPEAKGIFLQ